MKSTIIVILLISLFAASCANHDEVNRAVILELHECEEGRNSLTRELEDAQEEIGICVAYAGACTKDLSKWKSYSRM